MMTVEGTTNAAVFRAFAIQALAPRLQQGQVVIMDSLGVYKVTRILEPLKATGAEPLYLPPYSPD